MKGKGISVWLATTLGLGAVIGAGIFVLSGTAISLAGTGALIAFVLVGIVALIVAMELGELGSLMPHANGATYSYVHRAFGSELGFITGILMFFGLATLVSVVSLGFGTYLSGMLGMPTNPYSLIFAVALITALTIANLFGLRDVIKVNFVLVVFKIAILLLFVGFALYLVSSTGIAAGRFAFTLSNDGIDSIFAASVVVFSAYSGFQAISSFTDRIRGRAIGAAKALIASVVISIFVYAMVVFALLLLLPQSAYAVSGNPLSFALRASGAPAWFCTLINFGAIIATASASLAIMMSASKSLYQMAADGLLPRFARAYNRKTDSATNCVLITALVGIMMLFAGNIYLLASISNFGLLTAYLMTGFALIHFRRNGSRPAFKIPLYPYLPIVGIIALMALLIGMPKEALIIGVVLILSLIMAYYSLIEAESRKVVRIRIFD